MKSYILRCISLACSNDIEPFPAFLNTFVSIPHTIQLERLFKMIIPQRHSQYKLFSNEFSETFFVLSPRACGARSQVLLRPCRASTGERGRGRLRIRPTLTCDGVAACYNKVWWGRRDDIWWAMKTDMAELKDLRLMFRSEER